MKYLIMAFEKGFTFANFSAYLRHLFTLSGTLIFIFISAFYRGDIILLSALIHKSLEQQNNCSSKYLGLLPAYLQLDDKYNLKDLLLYSAFGILSSLLFYHIVCGFLQIKYYMMQREQAEEWKCQPNRFLTPSNEIHEIVVGTMNMILAGFLSGFLACWVMNDNYTSFYFKLNEYGLLYLALSIVGIFIWIEAAAYYSHRLLHTPFFYKLIHKQHHRYHSPTPYSLIAMSPFELIFYQSLFLIPIFTIPLHPAVFIFNELYVFYYGILDHSGVKLDALWPWQPDTMFHDNHHRYFHCNFGFNMYLFDYLHDTLEKNDRIYGEHIFGGKGKKKQ